MLHDNHPLYYLIKINDYQYFTLLSNSIIFMYIEQDTSSSNNVYFIYKQYISINNSSNILFKKAFKQDYHSTNFPIPNFDFIIINIRILFWIIYWKSSPIQMGSKTRRSTSSLKRWEPTLKVVREISKKLNIDANIVLGGIWFYQNVTTRPPKSN